MSHHISTKPFYLLTGARNKWGIIYSANEVGTEILGGDDLTFFEYDTEEELAGAVDLAMEQEGWYWRCENRIPSPPNPNEWDPSDCEE